MVDLANIADMTARGITVEQSEEAVVSTYLATASSVIRHAVGSNISQVTVTVILPGTCSTRIKLPGAPVTAVHAVTLDEVPIMDYRLSSGYLERSAGWGGDQVSVTYTYGLPTVPADIVDLTCRMAAQALTAYRNGDPATRRIDSERIGDYSVTYSDAETGTLSLSADQGNRLAARFGNGASAVRTV